MKYIFPILFLAISLMIFSLPKVMAQVPAAPTIPPAAINKTSCDANLSKNIVKNGLPRFLIIGCVTVSGKVVGVKPHLAPDGDRVFAVKLDKEFKNMTTVINNQKKMKGGIWVEEICQGPNKSKEAHHEGDCAFPDFLKHFKSPKRGDRLEITGIFLQDIREGGHTEIHPVSDVKQISKRS